MTRLETYLKEWDVMPAKLAARAGVSRGQLHRLRFGTCGDPTLRVMVALTDALSAMQRKPVYMVQLFQLAQADEAVFCALIRKPEK
jgi:predicted transcriptional regulator